jgi:hypothetical protein
VDYALETVADPAWTGVADPELAPSCRMHERLPEKAVVFKGMNICLWFYACSGENVSSVRYYFDFVAWWIAQICSYFILVGCYQQWVSGFGWSKVFFAMSTCTIYVVGACMRIALNSRIREKIQKAELVKNLFERKNKVDKKYTSLLGDVTN